MHHLSFTETVKDNNPQMGVQDTKTYLMCSVVFRLTSDTRGAAVV